MEVYKVYSWENHGTKWWIFSGKPCLMTPYSSYQLMSARLYPRSEVTWVQLTNTSGGRPFWHFNTHWCVHSEGDRVCIMDHGRWMRLLKIQVEIRLYNFNTYSYKTNSYNYLYRYKTNSYSIVMDINTLWIPLVNVYITMEKSTFFNW